jgi:hypothetical protein
MVPVCSRNGHQNRTQMGLRREGRAVIQISCAVRMRLFSWQDHGASINVM